ncbi:MAG: YybS family protein [Candidatus Hydrogenedentes bacterium]|nr:YybS family protein [Candidatus Hydrogenedentota bacterium]
MLQFALIWAGLLALGVALYPISVGMYPIPAAVLAARNRWKHTLAILVAAGLTPTISIVLRWVVLPAGGGEDAPDPGAGALALLTAGSTLEYIAFGLAGVLAGVGIARMWSYGRLVHVLTAYVFVLMALNFLTAWDAWTSQVGAMAENLRVAVHQQAGQTGNEPDPDQLNLITWLEAHAGSLVFGANYAAIFMVSCMFVSLTRFILRTRFGEAGPQGTFTQMRPPDWLVWLAIVSALLCLAYQRWPSHALSVVAWNSAVGLAAIYCVNGLSIFLYAVHAFRPNLLIFVLIVFVLINVGAMPLLMLIGLFDTWGDYRRKIDVFVAAREKKDGPSDDRMV